MIHIGWTKRLSCQLALAAIFGILFAEGAGWQYVVCALALICMLLLSICEGSRREIRRQDTYFARGAQEPSRCFAEQKLRECAARGAMLLFAGGLATGSFLFQDGQWRAQEQALCTGQQQALRTTVASREQKGGRLQLTLKLSGSKNQVIISTEECVYPLDSVLLVKGTIEGFDFPRNEGQFNEKAYYKSKQIIGRMRAEEIVCLRVPHGIFLWREALYRLRTSMAQVCEDMLPAEEAGILAAMLAGEKSLLDGETLALFQRVGIGHILAISGMHVSMIGMGVYGLLRVCRAGYVLCGGLTAFLLFCYGTMTGFGVSAERAVGMFFIFLLAQCRGRGYDARAALGATAFILLLLRPFLLHSMSFQFSFAAAYAIVTIDDLLKSGEEEAEKKRQLWLLGVRKPLVAAFLLQLCILPLMAYYDYELPFCALFLNLLLLPYAGVVMGFGLAGCGMALAGLSGAPLLFVPCKMVLSVYIWACRAVGSLPFSSVICGRPSEGRLWAYCGLLAMLIFALGRRKQKILMAEAAGSEEGRKTAYFPGGALFRISLCGALLLALLCAVPKGGFEISFLDVGQGDGSFIRTSEGVTCFVDGGSSDVSGLGNYRILPFLKSKGVKKIDYWLLSHLDEDHVSGFYEVLHAGYPIGAVVAAKGCVRDEAWERLVGTLEQCGVSLMLVCAGDALRLHNRDGADIQMQSEACIQFLLPDETAASTDDRNAESLVCLYEEQGFCALWTGDIGEEQEEELLSNKELFDGRRFCIDLYKAAHHGSNYSNSAEYLEMLAPRICVVSCAAGNRYGHPGKEALAHMEAAGSRIFCTMACGQVKVTRRGNQFFVATAKNP